MALPSDLMRTRRGSTTPGQANSRGAHISASGYRGTHGLFGTDDTRPK
ncbi:hypothetical protein [Haloarcula marina]|nr:hypothetical protein [Halomicroarcula marina]